MEGAMETDLLNEVVLLNTNYSIIRKSNFKWACDKNMTHKEFEITTTNNASIYIGW